jgi:hypothetical protein
MTSAGCAYVLRSFNIHSTIVPKRRLNEFDKSAPVQPCTSGRRPRAKAPAAAAL